MVCVAWQPLPLQHHFCHTHTTVTVIDGTAKQLLGSSTDWCATTIVTPHTRGATSTHTRMDGKVVWCGQCVETVVCINTCMVTSLCHTICVCHLISQVCAINSITPLLFYHTLLYGVCVWHCQMAFTLSLWLLMHWCWYQCPSYGTPCLPSTTACVCGDGVPALPWPCQPLATFSCVLSGVFLKPLLQFALTEGDMLCGVVFHQKSAMRDIMKRHTLAHFAFFRFLSSPLSIAHWEAVRVPYHRFLSQNPNLW